MNNMPYAALGGVMTADVNERTSLNSYRFVAVNIAQFMVGGLTLPLVHKFADRHPGDAGALAHGWKMTMMIWASPLFRAFHDHVLLDQGTHPLPSPRRSPRCGRISAISSGTIPGKSCSA